VRHAEQAGLRGRAQPPSARAARPTHGFHGYVELWLDGHWVKATPAFDRDSARRAGALLVELDGSNDAMLHPVDPQGHPYIEYVRDRGIYDDLPFDALQAALHETYDSARIHDIELELEKKAPELELEKKAPELELDGGALKRELDA
jgi:hypothetical protein